MAPRGSDARETRGVTRAGGSCRAATPPPSRAWQRAKDVTRRSDARSRRAAGAGSTPGDRNIVSRSSSARRNQSEARKPPVLRDLDPTGRSRNPQFSSVMEPRSPGHARLSRERLHERHDGHTHKDVTSEHPGPAFSCSFRVNEQLTRPHKSAPHTFWYSPERPERHVSSVSTPGRTR